MILGGSYSTSRIVLNAALYLEMIDTGGKGVKWRVFCYQDSVPEHICIRSKNTKKSGFPALSLAIFVCLINASAHLGGTKQHKMQMQDAALSKGYICDMQ